MVITSLTTLFKNKIISLINRWWPYLILLLYFIIQTIVYFNKSGFITGDLGREIYTPVRIIQNQIPYKDFAWLYGPLPLWVNVLIYKLFSINIQPLYYLSLVVSFAIAVLTYKLIKQFTPAIVSLIVTLIFIKVSMFGFTWQSFILPGKFATLWSTFFSLIVLNLIIRNTSQKPKMLLIGIVSGLIAITKIDYFLAISVTTFFFVLDISTKSLKKFILLSCFYLIGIFSIVTPVLFVLINLYRVSLPILVQNIFPTHASSFWFITRSFYDLTSFVSTLVPELVILILILFLSLKKYPTKKMSFLVKVIVFILLLIFLKKFDFSTIMFTFFQPLFTISVIVFLSTLFYKKLAYSYKRNLILITSFYFVLTLRDKFSVSACNMFFPLIILIGSLYLLVLRVKVLNKKIFTLSMVSILSLLLIDQSKYLNNQQYSDKNILFTGDRGTIIVDPKRDENVLKVVNEIKNNSNSNDTVVAFPIEASINFFSKRDNPLTSDQFVNGLVAPDQQIFLIKQLEKNHPSFITISNYEFLGYFGLDYNREIYKWIIDNYYLYKSFGCTAPYSEKEVCTGYGIQIYQPKLLIK